MVEELLGAGAKLVVIIGGLGGLAVWVRRKRRLHPAGMEDRILTEMANGDQQAVIVDVFGSPRHVEIGERHLIDPNDDAYRLKCLQAMTDLTSKGYVEVSNSGISFSLTAKGLERGRSKEAKRSAGP